MSSGPLPSQICLLSALPAKQVGDKVRFLACVTSYSTASGTLTLQHPDDRDANVSALVDVQPVLEKLGAEQTRVGEWVNVIGYVTSHSPSSPGKSTMRYGPSVQIQALLLWSAGPLDIQQYQIAVEALQNKRAGPAGQPKPASTALVHE